MPNMRHKPSKKSYVSKNLRVWVVYALVSCDTDEILYVGLTRQPKKRRFCHQSTDTCAANFTMKVIRFFYDREEASKQESFYINQIDPKYNKQSRGLYHVKYRWTWDNFTRQKLMFGEELLKP